MAARQLARATVLQALYEWDFYNRAGDLAEIVERDLNESIESGISLNPILNSFQATVRKYNIDRELIDAFLKSMRMDLVKQDYQTTSEYNEYIYGSADVVGLMCLKVFVRGDVEKYEALKESAMRLGSAFQKVNFLRDIKDDVEVLNRSYFPHADMANITQEIKDVLVEEIEEDFREAYKGLVCLPASAKFGVYTAYVYYRQLLKKLKRVPSARLLQSRVRVNNFMKLGLVAKSYLDIKLRLV